MVYHVVHVVLLCGRVQVTVPSSVAAGGESEVGLAVSCGGVVIVVWCKLHFNCLIHPDATVLLTRVEKSALSDFQTSDASLFLSSSILGTRHPFCLNATSWQSRLHVMIRMPCSSSPKASTSAKQLAERH